MRTILALLSVILLAACAKKNVPVNIDLTDEQVAALSADRSAALVIQVDDVSDVFNPAPTLSCQGLRILVRNSEVTDRLNKVLGNGAYPVGFNRMLQEYPEVARLMTCVDSPDGIFESLDVFSAERVAPGDYTLYVLASLVSGAGTCLVWQIPITVLQSEKTNLTYSKDLHNATKYYVFPYQYCK